MGKQNKKEIAGAFAVCLYTAKALNLGLIGVFVVCLHTTKASALPFLICFPIIPSNSNTNISQITSYAHK